MPPPDKYAIATLRSSAVVQVANNTYIYFEQRGNVNGPAVVYNHGGPGGSSTPEDSQWFDPEYFNIILYDQRGTGKSIPSVKSLDTDPAQFSALTIDDMAADLEVLRETLGIKQWLVFGGSWGSTLSLYYAAKYPKAVSGVIAYGIFLNKPEEMSQYFDPQIIKERFPQYGAQALAVLFSYAQSKGAIINPDSPANLMETYYQFCVNENDSNAQYLWTAFERFNDEPTLESLDSLRRIPDKIDLSDRTHAVFESIIFRQAYHGFNLLAKELLINLKSIDVRIIQGISDTEAPPIFARQLVDALLKLKPNLWYQFIEGKHGADSSKVMTQTLLESTDSFKVQGPLKRNQSSGSEADLINHGLFRINKSQEDNCPKSKASTYLA